MEQVGVRQASARTKPRARHTRTAVRSTLHVWCPSRRQRSSTAATVSSQRTVSVVVVHPSGPRHTASSRHCPRSHRNCECLSVAQLTLSSRSQNSPSTASDSSHSTEVPSLLQPKGPLQLSFVQTLLLQTSATAPSSHVASFAFLHAAPTFALQANTPAATNAKAANRKQKRIMRKREHRMTDGNESSVLCA